jgi:F-type H+-transporting ATPase subunit epsilon
MANFHFELVSPEKLLFSGEVEQVDVPGAEGDFGVLAQHAPMVMTVLADVAEAVEDIDRGEIGLHVSELESRIAKTEPGSELDRLITRLDHFKEVDRHLAGTAMH